MSAGGTGMKRRTFLQAGLAGAVTLHFNIAGAANLAASGKGFSGSSLGRTPALDSWIRIGADGRVTVFTGKAEIGQGILTALVQIASDELDVAPDRIDLVSADTARTPNEGYTAGSLSIQQSGMAVRYAAAELKHILLGLAVKQLGRSRDALSVTDGRVGGGRGSVTYWQLAAGRSIDAEIGGKIAPKTASERRLTGQAMPRVDIPDKVFGRQRYVHDMRLHGMLHGRVVRPPSYDQRLRRVDTASVETMPGVEVVVRDGSFLGVVARREEQAIAAAEALREAADWQGETKLPDTDTLAGFIRNHPDAGNEMIVDSAAPAGERRLAACYFRPFQAHASMGPSLALAKFEGDRLTVWSHSQGVYPLRGALADALGMTPEQVHVIHAEGAGCYGHNSADDVALDAALLSRGAGGRPVRVQWMREDEFRWEPYGSAMVMEIEATLDTAGKIRTWDFGVWGFPHTSRPGGGRPGNLLAARHLEKPFDPAPPFNIPRPRGGLDRNAVPPYRIPGLRVAKHWIAESPLRVSALRGLGAYANVFAIESFVDELAAAAGTDPVEFRLRHLAGERARAVIRTAAEMAGWSPRRKNVRNGTGQGIAYARYKNIGGYLAVVATVRVDSESGQIHVVRADAATDCGEVINPDGLKNQVEGGLIQSTSWTLGEAVSFTENRILSEDWASYPILTFPDIPQVDVYLMERPEDPPLGSGEVAQGPMAAAIANAVYDAAGVRLRDLPLRRERVKTALAG